MRCPSACKVNGLISVLIELPNRRLFMALPALEKLASRRNRRRMSGTGRRRISRRLDSPSLEFTLREPLPRIPTFVASRTGLNLGKRNSCGKKTLRTRQSSWPNTRTSLFVTSMETRSLSRMGSSLCIQKPSVPFIGWSLVGSWMWSRH